MRTDEWLDTMVKRGFVCREGVERLKYATSREDRFRILCDSLAVDFIPSLLDRRHDVPLDDFLEDYSNYVNGKAVIEYPKNYTSKMYVLYQGGVVADTTLCSLIKCDAEVVVPKNHYPSVILSRVTNAVITLCEGARLDLTVWEGATYSISGDLSRVRITKYPKK